MQLTQPNWTGVQGGAGWQFESWDIRPLLLQDEQKRKQLDPELPVGVRHVGHLGAKEWQVRKARLMQRLGLTSKARRQAQCGIYGARAKCSDTTCGCRYFRRFRCKLRYCVDCGPKEFRWLVRKYEVLGGVVNELLKRPNAVLAKVDLTVRNLGRMLGPEEVRLFNRLVREFWKRIAKSRGFERGAWGVVWCDEFGGANTNLHAHGVYCGPWIPQWVMSRLWKQVCKGTIFEGSFIVSIKRARSWKRALIHALKYPGKYVSRSTPERLAELEAAFHGVRRVHTMGAFYNVKGREEERRAKGDDALGACPECGAALIRDRAGWWPVVDLERDGYVDLEEARRRRARERIFRGPPRWSVWRA